MKERDQGMVIPFELSGSRLRKSAQEYRRRGQVLEALSLMRRAAEQEDTAWGWQALAAELRQLGCWEAAAVLLGRVLSREEHAPSAWLDMARCQSALGNQALAADCLYHVLQESPWSPEGDTARAMLLEVEPAEEVHEPRRTQRLIHRGMQAWYQGNKRLGLRRLARATRLAGRKERLMTTVALLHMLQGEMRASMKWLARAMRAAPEDAHVLCTMAAVLQQLEKPRMARAYLRLAAPLCGEPQMEERFFTTAWSMNAWPELEAFLQERLKRQPHRVPLLSMRATMLCEQQRSDEARLIWRQILSIDPNERRAAAMQAWQKQSPGGATPPPGRLPLPVMLQQRSVVLNGDGGSSELFRFGSEERRVLDWCAASADEEEQQLVLTLLAEQPDRAAEQRYLKELLTRPDVLEPLRQQALMRLAEMQCFDPLNVLMGDRYTTARCQMTRPQNDDRLWRMVLTMLLRELSKYDELPEIAEFAASLWRMTPGEERMKALTGDGECWCRAVEVLWLMQQGREEEAQTALLLRATPTESRRIRRQLQRFRKMIENAPGAAGKGDTSI